MSVYSATKFLLSRFFKLLFRVEITGKENIPQDGGLLVCSNHLSNWDPIILAAVIDRQVHYMAKKQLFAVPLLRGFLKTLGSFPINRGTADPSSLKTSISYIKQGEVVGIFPQGTRQPYVEPETTPVKSGVGLVVYRSKCDVLPISVRTKQNKVKIFRKVYINIGKPISYSSFGLDSASQAEYKQVTEKVFEEIIKLYKGENK